MEGLDVDEENDFWQGLVTSSPLQIAVADRARSRQQPIQPSVPATKPRVFCAAFPLYMVVVGQLS